MNIKNQLNAILDKEMDRKEFLKYSAAAGLMVAGAGAVVQGLANLSRQKPQQITNQSSAVAASAHGYGGGVYGGQVR